MTSSFHLSLSPLLAAIAAAAAIATSWGCGGDEGADADTEVASDTSDGGADVADVADNDGSADGAGDETAEADDGESEDVAASNAVNRAAPDIDLEGITGFRHDALTYTVPALEIERTLDLHVWYATDDTEGVAARFVLFADEFALEGAAVLPPDEAEPAPLLVYSHGGRGFSGQVSTMARQFVRNGWIVVAPSHPGDNLFDASPQPSSFPAIRAFDVMQAIDWVENLPDGHPLRGRVDTSRVLAMGHSYGGQNAWILNGLAFDIEGLRTRCGDGCTAADIEAFEAFVADPRVVAGISLDNTMDANLVPDAGYARVENPMLHMSGTEGNHGLGIFERAAAANLTWVSMDGGCHESFTGTLPCATLELSESLATGATYAVAFGTRHVLGSTDQAVRGILDGSVRVSERAELQRTERAQE